MKNIRFFRYLAYSIEILLFYILTATPDLLPDIFGAKPCILLAVALTIAVNEAEIPAMVFGMVCGVLIDLGYSTTIGVFAVMLTIVCFAIGFCANNLIAVNFYNVALMSLIVVTAVMSLHFLFAIVLKGYQDAGVYFVNHYISRIVQTVLCAIVLYFVNRFVYFTLLDEK